MKDPFRKLIEVHGAVNDAIKEEKVWRPTREDLLIVQAALAYAMDEWWNRLGDKTGGPYEAL